MTHLLSNHLKNDNVLLASEQTNCDSLKIKVCVYVVYVHQSNTAHADQISTRVNLEVQCALKIFR